LRRNKEAKAAKSSISKKAIAGKKQSMKRITRKNPVNEKNNKEKAIRKQYKDNNNQ